MKSILPILMVILSLSVSVANAIGYQPGQYYTQQGNVSQYFAYEQQTFISYSYQPNMCVYNVPIYAPSWQSEYAQQCGYQWTPYGFQQMCIQRQWWYFNWVFVGYRSVVNYCY